MPQALDFGDYIEFVGADGESTIRINKTDENYGQITSGMEIVSAYQQKREALYNERGATIEALTVALTEKIGENRSEAFDALMAIRVQVKSEIPKA